MVPFEGFMHAANPVEECCSSGSGIGVVLEGLDFALAGSITQFSMKLRDFVEVTCCFGVALALLLLLALLASMLAVVRGGT